jgi:hypothetical protein
MTMTRLSSRPLALAMIVTALAVGCSAKDKDAVVAGDSAGQADSAGADTSASSAASSGAPSTGATDESAPASITVADIDRWQRGMEAERNAVEEAGKKYKEAKTATDTMNAMFAANETSTRAAGASAAGVSENRYGLIGSTLSDVVSKMSPIENEMDVSKMPASMLTAMKEDRAKSLAQVTATLPPDLVEALRPRAAALRKQVLELTAQRMRAAGLVH